MSESASDPFTNYKITTHEPLRGLKRTKCKKCKGSRMFFCYKCYTYMDGIEKSKMPVVKLPFKLDIIKHSKEVDGKSTAIHAALLAPDDVRIYTYPSIPDYTSDKVLLIFPGKKASSMEEIFTQAHSSEEESPSNKKPKLSDSDDIEKCKNTSKYDKVVFIDCTWSQAYSIFTDERISHLPTVKLNDFKTVYWRHNEEMPYTYLATIEAIYFFLRHSHSLMTGSYNGQYDDLLYFYSYFHQLVQKGKKSEKK